MSMGLIPGWGTKIPQLAWHGQKKKKGWIDETKENKLIMEDHFYHRSPFVFFQVMEILQCGV